MRRFAPSAFASQPIEGVSERYSFLPTSCILNGMRENGWVPVRAQEQSIRTEARRGFQKHVVRFARLEHLQTWEKNQVRPEVVLVNSHDKSSAYQLHCGLFRLVCTNGMVVSDGTFQRISIKHSGFNPDSVIEASFKVLSAVPDIMNKVQLFQERLLTDAEQLALAYWRGRLSLGRPHKSPGKSFHAPYSKTLWRRSQRSFYHVELRPRKHHSRWSARPFPPSSGR
jgi:hypothetical protein